MIMHVLCKKRYSHLWLGGGPKVRRGGMSSASVPHPVGPRANCQLDVVISGLSVSKAERYRSSRDLYYPKYLIVHY